jgi:hypothetical protein
MGGAIKHMSVEEFHELGLLQEINRLFLHPRGLALEVTKREDGTMYVSGIWDYREDPEGILFADGVLAKPAAREKAKRVEALRLSHLIEREHLLGGTHIQPIPE